MKINYQHNIDQLIERIEVARLQVSAHHIVKIVAASKYNSDLDIKSLLFVGQRAFGENRVQDIVLKSENLKDFPIEWHFIGHIQKNKINNLIDANPYLIQSLDSLDLALSIEKRLVTKKITVNMLLQINSAKEREKFGVATEEALDIYSQINQSCPHINLKGLMSIGAHSSDKSLIKQSFEKTRFLFDKLPNNSNLICSMGMSSDYELAINCGSTMVRIGSKLFN